VWAKILAVLSTEQAAKVAKWLWGKIRKPKPESPK